MIKALSMSTTASTCLTGKYSEHAFQALDYILDEASKHGVRLLLTLVNNWDNADSKTQVGSSLSCPNFPNKKKWFS